MKRVLSVVALFTALLCGASVAKADTYSCDSVPSSVTGDATLTPGMDGNCSIGSLTATGAITFSNAGANFTASGPLMAGNDVNIEANNIELDDDVTSTSGNVLLQAFGTLDIQDVTDDVNAQLQGVEDVSVGDVQSGSGIWIHSSDSTIEAGDLEANQNDGGGNILIQSDDDASIDTITIDGSSTTGGLEIDAAQDGSNDVFTIGDNSSNGVNMITITTDSGSGNDSTFVGAGMLIANHGSGGSGGITINSMDDIVTGSTSSRNALILLDAGDGTITLPSGTLSDDGASGYGAGQIWLLANTISTDDNTVLSASQDSSVSGNNHSVTIGADVYFIGFGDNGLILHGDGAGLGSGDGGVSIGPESTVSITTDDDFPALNWTLNSSGATTTAEEVDFYDGPLTATANGEDAQVTVGAYPLNFLNHQVTLQSQGSSSAHEVLIGSTAGSTGTFASGLQFTGDSNVLIDASGASSGDSGGTVDLLTDGIWTLAPSVTLQANGNGNGDGGLVEFDATETDLWGATTVMTANGVGGEVSVDVGATTLEGTTVELSADGPSSGDGDAGTVFFAAESTDNTGAIATLTADGPSSGTGDGGTVTFFPNSDFTAGEDADEFSFSAVGGSSSGNGGTININALDVTVNDNDAVDVSVPSGSGDGGSISLTAEQVTWGSEGAELDADGGSTTGDGGSISIDVSVGNLSVGSDSGSVALSAEAPGSGNGGDISLTTVSPATIDLDGDDISVGAAGTNGNGGSISVEGGPTTVTDDIDASATGNGNGGEIEFSADSVAFDGSDQTITADATGSGNGGSITIDMNDDEGGNVIGSGSDAVALSASSSGTGNGGSITVETQGDISVDGASLLVTAGSSGNGNGGTIDLTSNTDTIAVTGTLDASGAGSGTGGTIDLDADGDLTQDDSSTISANGGCDSGNGGSVTLAGYDVTDATVDVEGGEASCMAIALRSGVLQPHTAGSGNGGTYTINVEDAWLARPYPKTANGQGSGQGGTITVNNGSTTGVDLSSFSTTLLTAKGGDSGEGGSVTIGKTAVQFDVNTVIKVDSGEDYDDTTLDGSITLNTEECQQYLTAGLVWPLSYWDCTGGTPTQIQSTYAQSLEPDLQELLDGSQTQLYTFTYGYVAKMYFSRPTIPSGAAGDTFPFGASVYSNFFQSAVTNSDAQKETVAHELGHAIDISYNFPSAWASASDTYNLYAGNDWRDMDYTYLGDTEMDSSYQPPCSSDGNAPFDGVVTMTGYSICTGSSLTNTNAWNADVDPGDGGLTNSAIAHKYDGLIATNYTDGKGWAELYAQAFAYANWAYATISTPANTTHPTIDGIYKQTYLQCTAIWATDISNGTTTGGPPTDTVPSYCSDSLTSPWSYTPFGLLTH